MSDPLSPLSAGDPIPTRRSTWNPILEAARAHRGTKGGRTGGGGGAQPLSPVATVLVRNDTGGDLRERSVVKVGEPVLSAVDKPLDVQERPALKGTIPAAGTDPFGVLIEAIPAGKIGVAAVQGVAVVDLAVQDEDDTHASPTAGSPARLTTGTEGSALIVWKEPGTGSRRGVVIITQAPADACTRGRDYYSANGLPFPATTIAVGRSDPRNGNGLLDPVDTDGVLRNTKIRIPAHSGDVWVSGQLFGSIFCNDFFIITSYVVDSAEVGWICTDKLYGGVVEVDADGAPLSGPGNPIAPVTDFRLMATGEIVPWVNYPSYGGGGSGLEIYAGLRGHGAKNASDPSYVHVRATGIGGADPYDHIAGTFKWTGEAEFGFKVPNSGADKYYALCYKSYSQGAFIGRSVYLRFESVSKGSIWLEWEQMCGEVDPPELTNSAPAANFSGSPRSGTGATDVAFTDLSTETPTTWLWEWSSDGGSSWTTFSTSQNPTHTFVADGTYDIRLTATNPYGSNSETKSGYVAIGAAGPVSADFTGSPTGGLDPLSVSLTDTSTNAPDTWLWEYDDGGGWTTFGTSQNPLYTFPGPGTYAVRLTATRSGDGSTDTATKTGYVTVSSPTGGMNADFASSGTTGLSGDSFGFTDSTTGGPPTIWFWEKRRNDGASSWVAFATATAQNPSGEVFTPGSWDIRLTVYYPTGGGGYYSDSETKLALIVIAGSGPDLSAGDTLSLVVTGGSTWANGTYGSSYDANLGYWLFTVTGASDTLVYGYRDGAGGYALGKLNGGTGAPGLPAFGPTSTGPFVWDDSGAETHIEGSGSGVVQITGP